jgi:hypothetical protein
MFFSMIETICTALKRVEIAMKATPKAKVTRSNRVGCANPHKGLSVSSDPPPFRQSAECPRYAFWRGSGEPPGHTKNPAEAATSNGVRMTRRSRSLDRDRVYSADFVTKTGPSPGKGVAA